LGVLGVLGISGVLGVLGVLVVSGVLDDSGVLDVLGVLGVLGVLDIVSGGFTGVVVCLLLGVLGVLGAVSVLAVVGRDFAELERFLFLEVNVARLGGGARPVLFDFVVVFRDFCWEFFMSWTSLHNFEQ